MKGILWYVTRKLEGIFDGILMEFRMRISEDKNQTQKSMYIPRFLSSGLYGSYSGKLFLLIISNLRKYATCTNYPIPLCINKKCRGTVH